MQLICTLKHLIKLWQKLKSERKDIHQIYRHNAFGTGGGGDNATQDPMDATLDSCIVFPVDGAIDNDNPDGTVYDIIHDENFDIVDGK